MKHALTGAVALAFLVSLTLAQSPDSKPAFEMADIHLSPPDAQQGIGRGGRGGLLAAANGRAEFRSNSLLDLVSTAYAIDSNKVIGGPTWTEWDRFDVAAKFPPSTTPDVQKQMLQSLLADRFKLVVHNDTQELPAYTLTAGKTPKLKPAEGSGDTGCRGQISGPGVTAMPGGGFRIDNLSAGIFNSFTCRNMTMEAFATYIRPQIFQNGTLANVADKTELKGTWDFEFRTSLQIRLPNATSTDMITIFDAVEKQLGLKLNQTKIPLQVVVIDSAQQPSPNAPGVAEQLTIRHPKEFDVATIKPSDPEIRMRRMQVTKGGGMNVEGIPLRTLILQAYGLRNDMLITAPAIETALSNQYNIAAKPPASEGPAPAPANGPNFASPDENDAAWIMMRALLEDRFKLKMHKEDRQLTAWRLVSVKPKMKKADPTERTKTAEGPGSDGKDPRTAMPARSRLVMFQNVTMDQFASRLQGAASGYLQTPVVNATGLEGSWDFTINFSPIGAIGVPGGGGRGGPVADGGGGAGFPGLGDAAEPNGAITLPEAIEQQLGLKLVEEKRPVTVYVIDSVEAKPTEN